MQSISVTLFAPAAEFDPAFICRQNQTGFSSPNQSLQRDGCRFYQELSPYTST